MPGKKFLGQFSSFPGKKIGVEKNENFKVIFMSHAIHQWKALKKLYKGLINEYIQILHPSPDILPQS